MRNGMCYGDPRISCDRSGEWPSPDQHKEYESNEREEIRVIKFEGMKAEENQSNSMRYLPAGLYVVQVLDARIEGNAPDQKLGVLFEIFEGEYRGWFMKKYKAQKERGSSYEIKYKGVIRIRIPNPENKNAQYPESDIRRFNDMIYRFEQSNDGFHWDGDETKLKGLLVGMSMQEDEFNGAAFTKPARFEIVDDVRNGKVKVMPPKGERKQDPTTNPTTDQQSGMEIVNTETLPWD